MPTFPHADLLRQTAATYNLPFDLLGGQMLVESSGDPYAFRYEDGFFDRYIRSNPNAQGYAYGPLAACSYGLLQIILQTALEIGFTDKPEMLFVPRCGLAWGAKKLRALLDWSGDDYPRALAAYNGGIGITRHHTAAGYPNQAYIDKVYRAAGR